MTAATLAVHFLAPGDLELARLFGEETDDEVDKFTRCEWRPGPAGVPILTLRGGWLAGPVITRLRGGDHVAMIVEPVAAAPPEQEGQLGFQAVRRLQACHPAWPGCWADWGGVGLVREGQDGLGEGPECGHGHTGVWPDAMALSVPDAFDRTVREGERRLDRSWPQLLGTGAMGGIDVSVGVYALLAVLTRTSNEVLAALFFGIGFIALQPAGSELFTENFLVPIAALVAGRSTVSRLFRQWGGALVTNLAGGWIMTGIIVSAAPTR